jgi:hypothetical protein
MKIEVTEKELQLIMTALCFSSCTDTCWDNAIVDQEEISNIAMKINKKYNVKPLNNLYIYKGIHEDPHIVEKYKDIMDIK